MPRDNHVYKKIKDVVLNNSKPDGWTSSDLGAMIGVRANTLRHVCDKLTDQGILVKVELEDTKKGECRVRYFRPLENGSDIYGVGMANKINVHNIFT